MQRNVVYSPNKDPPCTAKVCKDCKAKGNGQFVKNGESGEADDAVAVKTTTEIKGSSAQGGF